MSRDYKPAAKTSSANKSGSSMFVGIVIGLILGLGIALAAAMYIKNSPSPFVERKSQPPITEVPAAAAPSAGASPVAATAPADKPKAPDKPHFDFYTILPGTEEPVTEKDLKQQAPDSTAKSEYYLQAGAFQNDAEADDLKAKLALMGVEASIQTVTVPDKGVWHRVRVGPYNNVDDVNRARNTLAQNGVSASLIKVHDQPVAH